MAMHNFPLKDLNVFWGFTVSIYVRCPCLLFFPFLHLGQSPARPLVREALCLSGTETSELVYLLNPERNRFSSLLLHQYIVWEGQKLFLMGVKILGFGLKNEKGQSQKMLRDLTRVDTP
jgi:hypothetical protein